MHPRSTFERVHDDTATRVARPLGMRVVCISAQPPSSNARAMWSAVRSGLEGEILRRRFQPSVARQFDVVILEERLDLDREAGSRPAIAAKPTANDTRIRTESSRELVDGPVELSQRTKKKHAPTRVESSCSRVAYDLAHERPILPYDSTVNCNNTDVGNAPIGLGEMARAPRPQGDTATDFGRRIRAAREDAGMSQNQVNTDQRFADPRRVASSRRRANACVGRCAT